MTFLRFVCLGAVCATLLAACQRADTPGNLVPKTVDQDPSLPAISVNGALLHSEAFGHPDSTIVVCLHGGPGSDYRYMLNCKELAEHGYRVVFYDQRGTGLSQRFPKSYYAALGDSAIERLFYSELTGVIAHYRTHAAQKVYLLGQSWGAMMATGYAGKYPNAVQGLVVMEPGGFTWDEVLEYVGNARRSSFWGEFINNATYKDQFFSGKTDQHELLDYQAGLLSGDPEPNTGDGGAVEPEGWRMGAVENVASFEIGTALRPDFSAGISRFKTPVLFIYSEENTAYPTSWATKLSSVYPSVEVYRTKGSHSEMVTNKAVWQNMSLPKVLAYFRAL